MNDPRIAPVKFKRVVGGDGCELTIICERIPEPNEDPEATRVGAFPSNADLPEDIKKALPEAVQTLYRETYNHIWNTRVAPLRRSFTPTHAKAATRAAWAAVKRMYVQVGNEWLRRRT